MIHFYQMPPVNEAQSLPQKSSPKDKFLKNLKTNTLLALGTVPAECLAVRRIVALLERDYLHFVAPFSLSYIATIQKLGIRKLFSGALSRLSYCLVGNYTTILGMDFFGADSRGLFYTSLAKNLILPLSLLANARQCGLTLSQTFHFVTLSSIDPVVHASFFFRNLVANSCLLPGLVVRNYLYRALDQSDSKIPNLVGMSVSVTTSTIVNAFLKPFFTGKYPLESRCTVAYTLPALFPLFLRETASIGLIFANTSP